MPTRQKYIARIVNLAPQDYRTIRRLADEKGLGSNSLTSILRIIVRA